MPTLTRGSGGRARHIAWQVLMAAEPGRKILDRVLAQFAPRLDTLDRRDRSLAQALIYGSLRWRGHLDWIIAAHSQKPLKTMDTSVLWLLRMALFQITRMEKIPVSAAVNTAVDLAGKEIHRGAAGFVNAVLRSASKGWQDLPLPDPETAPDHFLAVSRSIPPWLARRWIHRYGMDAATDLCDAMNQIPPITLRTNTLKVSREQLCHDIAPLFGATEKTGTSPWGIRVQRPAMALDRMTPFTRGGFQVQDEAAQLVTAHLLDPRPGDRVLDACAGLGGKTGHIAQLMANQGTLVAGDTDPDKLNALEREMTRLGITMVTPCQMDLLEVTETDFDPLFDRVLVDAPCSGLGVLRRNPDTRWKRTRKDIARLAVKQEKMLTRAARLVKPGGRMVYAVCSCEPRENETVVDHFLARRPDFTRRTHFPGETGVSLPPPLFQEGIFRTFPHALEMDGFFAVALERARAIDDPVTGPCG